MDVLSRIELKTLVEKRGEWCVSLYLPTHRAGRDIQQDPIRLKNLLRNAEERLLAGGLRTAEARSLLAPAQALLQDEMFWRHQSDGLAIFLSPTEFHSYRLPLKFPEIRVVTDRFHIKPLLPLVQSGQRFFVLALSQNQVRLLDCTQHHVDEVDLENVPTSLAEALKYDDPEKQLQFHTGTPSGQGQRAAIFHGHGVGVDDAKDRILRYFQQVNKGLQTVFQDERAPLVLAAVEYLLPIYRGANTYAHLVSEGITGNPDTLPAQDLHQQAWTIVQPLFQKARADAVAQYRQLTGTKRASNTLEEIVPAAYHGRVECVFVAVGVQEWGTFDTADNTVHVHRAAEPGDEDLLDFAAVQTFLNGGTVYAVPPPEVPDNARLVAVFRY
jgi:hypothetical protein